MPVSGETNYSVRVTVPDVLQNGRDNVVALEVEHEGETVHPSSGTFTLFAQGSTAVVDAQATTFHAGRSQYTIPSSALDTTVAGVEYGDGWLEEWALTISGTVSDAHTPCAIAVRPRSGRRRRHPAAQRLGPCVDTPSLRRRPHRRSSAAAAASSSRARSH